MRLSTDKDLLSEFDHFLEPFYYNLRSICIEEGLTLKRNYSISDGSNEFYLPIKSSNKYNEKITHINLTYYEEGYEVFGEICIDLENKAFTIDFPNWGVSLKKTINEQKIK
jgi:hypothetical protein